MKFGVVVFPGSNCDHDAFYALGSVLHKPVEFIWHGSQDLANCDAIVLPGGFSYGDYLRTGAIARFSPVMKSVEKFAGSGGMVLGICNGFQTLCEAGLLPGAMMRNSGLRFICRHVYVRVEQTDTPFTNAARKGQILKIPIAHSDGNWTVDGSTLAELEKNRQVIFLEFRERRAVHGPVAIRMRDGNLEDLALSGGVGERRVGLLHANVDVAADEAQSAV